MSHADSTQGRATDQSVPLASFDRISMLTPRPADLMAARRRSSLLGLDSTWTRAPADDVYLNAIAELREDPRRASLAIRRQSLLQSQQASPSTPEPAFPDSLRTSISTYPRVSSVEDGQRQRLAARKQSILVEPRGSTLHRTWSATEGRAGGRGSTAPDRRWSGADERWGSMAQHRGSMADRRGSVAALPQRWGSRRASVLDTVQETAVNAVRRASLAMYIAPPCLCL